MTSSSSPASSASSSSAALSLFSLPLWALVVASFFWGTTFIFTKILIAHLAPFSLLVLRFALTAAMLFALFPRQILRESRQLLRNRYFMAFSLVNFIAIALQTVGLQYTSAAKSGVITSFCILIVPLINQFLFKQKAPALFYIVVVVAFVAIYVMSLGLALPQNINLGDLLTLGCAFAYGLYIALIEKIADKFSGASIMFWAFITTLLGATPLGLLLETAPQWGALATPLFWGNLLGIAFIGGVLPYLLMAYGQRYVPSAMAALIYILEPIFAAFLAFTFLGETFSSLQILAMVAIIGCLIAGVTILRQYPTPSSNQ